jgi:ABC-type antimicrobial peptide transport system permease subunit
MRLPLFPARIAAAMFGGFGSLALLLAGVGVFGVVSFTANRRVQEIGIRMALGARRANVVRMIVRQGMTPIVVGMIAGLGGTLLLTPLIQMRVVLYGVSERDPATFAAIAIVLTVVGLLAWYIPARRASGVDPVRALRQE